MSADGHDNWHQHTAEEGMPQEEHGAQASAKVLGLTFIGLIFGVLAVILILYFYFDNYMDNYRAKINEDTQAAEASWNEKQDILNTIEPAVIVATEQVIAEYASSN